MHAVVVTASVATGQLDTARKMLREEVVPRVSKSPGFMKGYWTISADGTQGISMTVFDTKENAEGAADRQGLVLSVQAVREVRQGQPRALPRSDAPGGAKAQCRREWWRASDPKQLSHHNMKKLMRSETVAKQSPAPPPKA